MWTVRHHELARLIDEKRAEPGSYDTWSFETLGRATGISGKAVKNIYSGMVRQPDPSIARGLADLLGVPVETITDGPVPLSLSWLDREIAEGLERLDDPRRQQEIARSLRNLLWLRPTHTAEPLRGSNG
jgi:transcriptional regulator with XRE-family HTH domain